MKPPLEQNYYELLEVPRDATIAELDRAYDRAKAYYGPGSIATYSLASPDELKLVQDRIDEAYLVLADEKARAEYLARIGPPTPDERPLHREVREAQAERDAARDKDQAPPKPAAPEEVGSVDAAPGLSKEVGSGSPSSAEPMAQAPGAAPVAPSVASGRETATPLQPREDPPASKPDPIVAPAESLPEVVGQPPAVTGPSLPGPAGVSAEQEEKAVVRAAAAPGPVPPPLMEYPEPIPKAAAKGRPEGAPARQPVRVMDIPADAVFGGELLRQVRESNGLSLQELADRTKIGKSHLDNIEADRYDALPAQVYLRGFLMSYARVVRLDPLRVAKSYLDAATKARAAKAK